MDIKNGDWVSERTIIGKVLDIKAPSVHVYLEQSRVNRVKVGDTAYFYAESGAISPLKLTVIRVDSDTTRNLSDEILASTNGGKLLVRQGSGEKQLIPEDALYQVVLSPELKTDLDIKHALRGQVVIYGETKSWFGDQIRYAIAILRREAGF